ncbi:hypothetical protein [Tsuneonella mangrovi]|uniref:hypothetical protein n=1 Tax=Tsuneonella mangrovi TaxID=1982042 RepID=UPI0014714F43|nr:hypothetical protein [Tsuneonella mangrovi]
MSKSRKKEGGDNTLKVTEVTGEDREKILARLALNPGVRHASIASSFASPIFGKVHEPSIMHDTDVLMDAMAQAIKGDKAFASELLAAQALALDSIFTELARRSGANLGEYIDAADRYMRLALKAQTNCRATLEALAKLHQPREQTVKHVHVNEGGQAVVADHIHQHQGDGKNEKTGEQSHATGTAGSGSPMLGQDSEGVGVPVASREGPEALQDARRDESRRA